MADDLIPTRASLLMRLKDWDDSRSWEDFFNTYWRLIYGRALNAHLTDQEAQEVVQETVIAVAKRIRELHYDPAVASFKTWLFQVVSRRIADQYRKRQRAGRVLEPLPDGSDARMIEQVADPSSMQPDAQWEREWEENILASALDRLKKRVSAAQYQIYDYHVVQRHGVRDTARHLGTKAAAVYLAKHRVGRLLRREVEQLRQTLV